MNRVVMTLGPQGEFEAMCADQEIEFFIVDERSKNDRVYQYGSGEFGPHFVHALIGGEMIGHIDDDVFRPSDDGTKNLGTGYGKKPPSRPKLKAVDTE